jgi:hypothetical protein
MSANHRNRRTAAAVLLLGLGLGAWVALAPAATTIRVTQPDGDVKRVDIADVDPDVGPNQEYVVEGESREVTGVSLEALLRRAGVPPRLWQSVQVGSVFMTDDEYDRFGEETPPAFFDDQGDAAFIVPDRGSRLGVIVPGAPSVTASRYSVRITPEAKQIDAGDSVTFRAEVTGGPVTGLNFRWSGSGLDTRSGRAVTYRFPDKGRKTVQVVVARGGSTLATASTGVFVDRKPADDGGTGGDDGGSGTGTGGLGYTDPTTPSATTTPTYTPPTYDPPTATPSTTPSTPEATPDEPDSAPSEDPTTEVAGDLLSDTAPIAPEESAGEAGGVADAPEETLDDDPELAISGAAVAAGLAAVLLGLGAGWEFERIHPRRLLRRPDLSRLRRLLPRRWL